MRVYLTPILTISLLAHTASYAVVGKNARYPVNIWLSQLHVDHTDLRYRLIPCWQRAGHASSPEAQHYLREINTTLRRAISLAQAIETNVLATPRLLPSLADCTRVKIYHDYLKSIAGLENKKV